MCCAIGQTLQLAVAKIPATMNQAYITFHHIRLRAKKRAYVCLLQPLGQALLLEVGTVVFKERLHPILSQNCQMSSVTYHKMNL